MPLQSNSKKHPLYYIKALSLFLILPAWSFAQHAENDVDPNNLIAKSPFLPPGYGAQAEKPPPPAPVAKPVVSGQLSRDLEFRGVFQLGDSPIRFSIFDKKEQKGYWVELDGGTDRFDVVEYKADSGSIIVSAGGQREEIFMSKTDGAPISIAGGYTPPNNGNNAQINPNNNNNDAPRRVIPRRRIIRRRTNTNNANTTPAPPPPPSS